MSANVPYNTEPPESEYLVDEEELRELGLRIDEPKPPRRGPPEPRLGYPPERVDSLLAQAGFEPSAIPRATRLAALFVAWAWAKGLGDDEEVARATDRSVRTVRRAARALRIAPKPKHTNTGENR